MKRNRISGNAGVGCGVFKNAAILFTIILISIGYGNSSAQSTNYDNRLVGAWVIVGGKYDGEEYVFNSDGTVNSPNGHMNYGAIDGKMVIKDRRDVGYSRSIEYVISKDGKTLLLMGGQGEILRKKQ